MFSFEQLSKMDDKTAGTLFMMIPENEQIKTLGMLNNKMKTLKKQKKIVELKNVVELKMILFNVYSLCKFGPKAENYVSDHDIEYMKYLQSF